jgi:hypothetical protein
LGRVESATLLQEDASVEVSEGIVVVVMAVLARVTMFFSELMGLDEPKIAPTLK